MFVAFSQYLGFTIQVTMEQWNQNILEVFYHFDFTKFQLLLSRTEKLKNIPITLKKFTCDFENILAPLCMVLCYFMTYVQCTYNMQSISRYAFVGKFDIFPKKPVGNTTIVVLGHKSKYIRQSGTRKLDQTSLIHLHCNLFL